MNTTLAPMNGKNGTSPTSAQWLHISVKEFFAGVNWEDQTPEVQELKLSATLGSDEPRSLLLTVSQFFGSIPWDGAIAAKSAPVPDEATSPAPVNNFTLDDFSSLF